MSNTINHPERLDQLFQYTLAVAAQSQEFRNRELGPIHLLKYAYLADVAHAERNQGQTYTGTDWGFHHFGPWSALAFQRIEPSLAVIAATTKRMKSNLGDDFTRYALGDVDGEDLLTRLEELLPFTIISSLGRALHEYGTDTESLLRHVYLTPPMLAAKPGELLDFSTTVRRAFPTSDQDSVDVVKLSSKARKERAVRLAEARAKIAERLVAGARGRVAPTPAPRFDDLFLEGTAQLEASSGSPIEKSEGTLEFHDSIWASDQRRGDDIP